MTNTTKIILAVTAALLIALLGAYLWIEYGGSSDDSESELTVEEQSPRIDTGPTADAADDSEAETETPDNSEAAQTSEAEEAADNGSAEDTAPASPDAPASAGIPDEFSTQLQDGIQEIIDFTETMKAQAPDLAPLFVDMTLASVEGLADLDAQLRRQGTELEERRMQLLKKYLKNTMSGVGRMQEAMISLAQSGGSFDPERITQLSQSMSAAPMKLMTLLRGGMSDQELEAMAMEMPEVRGMMKGMEQRFGAMSDMHGEP